MSYRILVLYPYNIFAQAWLMEVLATSSLIRYSRSLIFLKAINIFPIEENVAHKSLFQILQPRELRM